MQHVVAHSGWIQFEIDFARTIGKPLPGVRPRGAEVMPHAVTSAAKEIVNWQTDSIVEAICKLVA